MQDIQVCFLKSIFEKSVGLIGKKEITPTYFRTRFGIHTFGMKVPIDVMILDDDFVVRSLRENFMPGKIFLWNFLYQHVIELPTNYIKKHGIKIGEKIVLQVLQ